MTFDDYRAIQALNWSTLKPILNSPLEYRWRLDHPRPDTPALQLGRAVHSAVLEPDVYESSYRVAETLQCTGWTTRGTQCSKPAAPGATTCHLHGAAEELEELAARGVQVIAPKDAAIVEQCRQSVAAHDAASHYLDGTEREVSITWTERGVPAKGRLDAIGSKMLIDLKTTRSLAGFERDASHLYYHAQLAWYRRGAVSSIASIDDPEVVIIAVETVEPFDVGVFILKKEDLEAGDRLVDKALDMYLACRETGIYPGREPVPRSIRLPPWTPGYSDDGGEL